MESVSISASDVEIASFGWLAKMQHFGKTAQLGYIYL
jgi:hypothetical protein